jgi:SAM-dependent methyltransferase
MRLPPILKALGIQLIAAAGTAMLGRVLGLQLPLWAVTLAVGMLAAGLTILAKFPRWWVPIQLVFFPALVLTTQLNLSAWFYLTGFLLLAAIYWSTYRSQIPLYLSSRLAWHALEDLLPQQKGFRFADIGAGLGGVLAHLARGRPDGLFVGVENAPLPYMMAWLRLYRYANCTMRRADFWQMNFADYDVVYAYLSPVPMASLWEKAKREMRAGTLLISNSFEIPGQSPDRVIELADFHRSRLLVWVIR